MSTAYDESTRWDQSGAGAVQATMVSTPERGSPQVAGRTMGEVRASLPFSDVNLKPLRAEPLPGDGLPTVHLPT